eukprot:3319763-Rhodomonas_salina.3
MARRFLHQGELQPFISGPIDQGVGPQWAYFPPSFSPPTLVKYKSMLAYQGSFHGDSVNGMPQGVNNSRSFVVAWAAYPQLIECCIWQSTALRP